MLDGIFQKAFLYEVTPTEAGNLAPVVSLDIAQTFSLSFPGPCLPRVYYYKVRKEHFLQNAISVTPTSPFPSTSGYQSW